MPKGGWFMNITNISCLLLFFFTNFLQPSPFAARLMLDSTKEPQPIQQKNPLFIQAKKCEIEYLHVCEQCLQTNDCRSNKQYRQARKSLVSSVVDLISYIDSFEDDATTDTDEKNDAENIKNQLIQLLEHTTKK
jgi:hypothetical protein